MSGGLGARGIIPGRPNDRMGIGVYAMFASNDFKDASILLDDLLEDEVGFEAYYNLERISTGQGFEPESWQVDG